MLNRIYARVRIMLHLSSRTLDLYERSQTQRARAEGSLYPDDAVGVED